MMIADALNLHVYPIKTEMTGTKHIPTSHVCSKENRKPKGFLVDKNLPQIFSMHKDE